MDYTGYVTLSNEKDISNLYKGDYNIENLKENQYIIIEDKDGRAVDYYKVHMGELVKVGYPVIESNFSGQIKPRNPQQYCAMDLLKNNSIPVKLLTGCFGSGKSMLCIDAALEQLQKGNFEKIIFIRNNVQVKDTDQLGALPGSEEQKMLPYLMPFCDHCGGLEGAKALMDCGKLEIIPLGFLRGRSIRNAILYAMESENLLKEHIQLLMGRIDEGSQLWMDGDIKQRDRLNFEKSKGLEVMVERLSGNHLFGYINLIKSERSEVAALADLLD